LPGLSRDGLDTGTSAPVRPSVDSSGSRAGLRRGAARGAGLLAAYTAVVLWLTWPLARHAATHLPATHLIARFEVPYVAWVLAYQAHALTTDPARLADANIYYPARHALFYGPTCWGLLPYFAPTFLTTGNPALALNLAFLACLALTAWTLHLAVRRWTGCDLAGFLAAWTFLTTRWVLWNGLGPEPNYAVLQYIPLIMLLAAERAPGPRAFLLLLALVVLEGMTSPAYIAPAVVAPLGLLGLSRLARSATRREGFRLLGTVVVAAAVLVSLHAGHVLVRRENPALPEQTLWPGAPYFPTLLPWGPLTEGPAAIPRPALYLVLAGALLVALESWLAPDPRSRRAWTQGALWTAVGLAISIAPSALWYGRPIQLPHTALARSLGVYQLVREPGRLAIGSLIGLSSLSGLAFAACTRWLARPGRRAGLGLAARATAAFLLAAAFYGDYAYGTSPGVPPLLPLIAAPAGSSPLVRILRHGVGPVLEIPAGWLDRPSKLAWATWHAQAMYRSTFHWRPLLNGYSGYWPAGFPEHMALGDLLPDAQALAVLRRETGLATLVVHRPALAAARQASWDALAARGGDENLELVGQTGDDLVFAVRLRP